MIDQTASVRPLNAGADHSPPNSVTVTRASAREEPENPWITFALVAVGAFMIMLDTSIAISHFCARKFRVCPAYRFSISIQMPLGRNKRLDVQ